MIQKIPILKKYLNAPQLKGGVVVLVLWVGVVLGGMYFSLPYGVAVQLSPNPWQPITAETYPAKGAWTIDFVDSSHGWLGAYGGGGIMATTDGGQTWQRQGTEISSTIIALDFINTQVGVAITEKKIWITQNGGGNWTLLDPSLTLWDVVICDEQTAWVMGNYGRLIRINIPNHTWTLVSNISTYLFRLAMVNSTHGWAAGGYGVIVRTQDGWQTHENQTTGVATDLEGIFFWNALKGWAVGWDNTIIATVDGGATWHVQYRYQALFGIISLYDIYFRTEFQGWAVGAFGIHYTENGGRTWLRLPDTGSPWAIAFANQTHGWAVGYQAKNTFMTTVGGHIAWSEELVNLGYGAVVFGVILVLAGLVIYVRRLKHPPLQRQLSQDASKPIQLCAVCGHRLFPQTHFCGFCGTKHSNHPNKNSE